LYGLGPPDCLPGAIVAVGGGIIARGARGGKVVAVGGAADGAGIAGVRWGESA